MFDPERLIHKRAHQIDASGIRRVFDLAAQLDDPINLSIGEPHFDVPEPVKEAAIEAIRTGDNHYTVTQGKVELRRKIAAHLSDDLPNWQSGLESGELETMVSSGVSGGLVLALLACVGPGHEVLISDPYFVMYHHLVRLVGATPVCVNTYPDFQFTPERIEPLISPRSRMIIFNSPANPTGAVAGDSTCRAVAQLASKHGLLLLSDEVYDEFCYEKIPRNGKMRCPSPAAHSSELLLLRGFSKTYSMTGWRMGYAAGPRPIIEQMNKLQQYSFVCAPSMVQRAGLVAMDLDLGRYLDEYRQKRDRVVERLEKVFGLIRPGGAFYAFPQLPEGLGLDATRFVERAVERGVLVIPGSVFSRRDTHFRLSYACEDQTLEKGLDILVELAGG